jgi:hypothetical protein
VPHFCNSLSTLDVAPVADYQPAAENPSENGRVIRRHLCAHVDDHHTAE